MVGLSLTLAASALGATLTLVLARVRFGDSVLGLSRVLAVLLFLPIGVLGVPALGFGRNRISLLLNQGNVDTLAAVAARCRSATGLGAHHLGRPSAAGRRGGRVCRWCCSLVTALVFVVAAQTAFEQPVSRRLGARSLLRSDADAAAERASGGGSHAPGGPVLGLLQKDWRTLVRDPRWRTGALVSLVALGLPALVLFAGDPFARLPHALRFWFGMLPVPYLAYLLGSQQGAATLAYEGRNITLLRAAPVGMGRIMLAKVLGGLVLVMVVTWAATLGAGDQPRRCAA